MTIKPMNAWADLPSYDGDRIVYLIMETIRKRCVKIDTMLPDTFPVDTRIDEPHTDRFICIPSFHTGNVTITIIKEREDMYTVKFTIGLFYLSFSFEISSRHISDEVKYRDFVIYVEAILKNIAEIGIAKRPNMEATNE